MFYFEEKKGQANQSGFIEHYRNQGIYLLLKGWNSEDLGNNNFNNIAKQLIDWPIKNNWLI